MLKAIPDISKKILVVSIAALFLVSMILFILPGKIYGATLTVGPGGSGSGYGYATIQDAITAANPFDTINVAAGTYYEDIQINKPLTIDGAGPDLTILDGNSATENYYMVSIEADNVTVKDLAITNPLYNGTTDASGIITTNGSTVRKSNLHITNVKIHDIGMPGRPTEAGTQGINIGPVDGLEIDHSEIYNIKDNNSDSAALGITLWGNNPSETAYNINIHDNMIYGITNPVWADGINVASDTTNVTINKNTVTGPFSRAGIVTSSLMDGSATITNNTVTGASAYGILLRSPFAQTVTGNTVSGATTGIQVNATVTIAPTINSNSISGNTTGLNNLSANTVDATNNWWGDASGPSGAGSGTGDVVSTNVDFTPWYTDEARTTLSNAPATTTTTEAPAATTTTTAPATTTTTEAPATTTVSSGDIAGLISNGIFLADSPIDAPKITVTQQTTINVPFGSGTSSVTLPAGTEITNAAGGNINPSALAAAGVTPSSLSGLGTGIVVDGAFQWGIAGLGLQFSQPITITIYVGTALASQTLTILRSISETSDWTSDGIVPPATAVVDAAGYVTFQATKASYYAATHTVAAVVEPQPSAPSKPLTPEEQASLNLSIAEQVDLYGASNIGFTKMLYDNILGRVLDDGGLNDWVTALNNGTITLGSVVYNFVFSKELEPIISSASPEEFITFLYKNVFNREQDSEGYNGWVSAMKNGMSKEDVLLHFLDSDEFKNICTMFGLTP